MKRIALPGSVFILILAFSFSCEKPVRIVKVRTDGFEEISYRTCKLNGTIIDIGPISADNYGFCYSKYVHNPNIDDQTISLGTINTTRSYTAELENLEENTTYYYRAFVQNKYDIYYGDEMSFKTLQTKTPLVTTRKLVNITDHSAIVGGLVTDNGGSPIVECGVYYGSTHSPELTGTKLPISSGMDEFFTNLTGLPGETNHYVIAYATNSMGTGYGAEKIWYGIISDYTGNKYRTVAIGDQVWMAENLKVGVYADGTKLPLVENSSEWDNFNNSDKAYCFYDNNKEIGDVYGALYTWAAATNASTGTASSFENVQGICPEGWHLPSDEEWQRLELSIGMNSSMVDDQGFRGYKEGGLLKEVGFEHWAEPNACAEDLFGFSVLGAGYRSATARFYGLNEYTQIWTSSESLKGDVWNRRMGFEECGIWRDTINPKVDGFSVRCVKD